jgi:hypothetical protein
MGRTIVVFQAANRLYAVELEDLSAKPQSGEFLVFRGNRMQVTDVTESLGEKTADGKKRSGNMKLLEILGVLIGDETKVLQLFSTLMYVGSKEATTAGGILVAGSGMSGEFDNVVFVRLRAEKQSAPESSLLQLVARAEQLTGGNSFAAVSGRSGKRSRRGTGSLKPITVTGEASTGKKK